MKKKTLVKTGGWAFITTIIFVVSGMITGVSFETAFAASLLGTGIKTPIYAVYEWATNYFMG